MLIDKYDPEVQELLISCMNSSAVFNKTFFPDEVSSEYSLLHREIFKIIDGESSKKAIAAPRGLGKTTLAKLRVCKAIVFREVSFIIYLSNSATSAEASTEHIKRLLQSNEMITKLFGPVTFSSEGFKDSFSKQSWVAYGDVFVLPRGAGQQVRGQNWMGHRPGLIVIDDLEDSELVRSDEQRFKLSNWFFADLMKTESKYDKGAEFLYIDTIKHEDSLLKNLIDASDWDSVCLSICDQNFNSYDPNYMTTEALKQEYENHKSKGKADLFFMEYMNIPISLMDAVFKPEYYKYFNECGSYLECVHSVNADDSRVRIKDLVTVVIVDPARTVNLSSAESAIVVVSVDRKMGRIFVRDIISKRVRPDELYDDIFKEVLLFNAMILAVEVTGLCEFISQPLLNQMRIRGITAQFIALNAKGDKDMRISTLAPNYRLGHMYHNKTNCTALENQLMWHPKSKLKDIMDALSYITIIMENHHMYFDPDESDADYFEDEFDELENDDNDLNDSWRLL